MDLQSLLFTLFVSMEKPVLKAIIGKIYDANPTTAKLVVAEIYPLIDTKLEDWVKQTQGTNDDNAVAKAKEVCEELAKDWNMQLSNVDEGTPND